MRVLVTGAEGYIGAMLVPYLEARGHVVSRLDTGYYVDGWFSRGSPPVNGWLRRDVRDVTIEDLRGLDAVIHLADLSNDPLGAQDPAVTMNINYIGATRLARLCKDARVTRFLYSSSCSVYGVGSEEPRTEQSDKHPQTQYAECKVLVEARVSRMADEDFSPTYFRNATAYGVSPRMRFDLVLNNLAGLAWTTSRIALSSDGTPWRPLVHVLDICHAFACALEAPREAIHNEIFNVGQNSENYRVREIAEIIGEAFPGCAVTLGTSDGDSRSYRVNFDKIHAHLPGFRCQYTVADGARELRRHFEDQGLTPEIFQFRAFTRLRQLQHLRATGQLDQQLYWTPTVVDPQHASTALGATV